jgi:hypothetical protein
MDTANELEGQRGTAYGIRLLVASRDLGWIEQDGKPVLFSDRVEAELHAGVMDARSSDGARYVVAAWPSGGEAER